MMGNPTRPYRATIGEISMTRIAELPPATEALSIMRDEETAVFGSAERMTMVGIFGRG